MKNVFIDTNVLIDFIADRQPHGKFALKIFSLAAEKKVRLYTSSHSVLNTHYILKKEVGEKIIRGILYGILEFVKVVPGEESFLKQGLLSKNKDFEDALQIVSANSIEKMSCIITRNIKDFKNAEIPVVTPEEFISSI